MLIFIVQALKVPKLYYPAQPHQEVRPLTQDFLFYL